MNPYKLLLSCQMRSHLFL